MIHRTFRKLLAVDSLRWMPKCRFLLVAAFCLGISLAETNATPAAPTGLTVAWASFHQVALAWEDDAEAALGISAPALSYHLRLLKQAGLMLEYREKNFIFFELNVSVLDEMVLWFQNMRGEQ